MENRIEIESIQKTNELISWLEIIGISIYLVLCFLLVVDNYSPHHLLAIVPIISLIVPPEKHHKFPLFTRIGDSIAKFKPSSTFFITVSVALLVFSLQALILFLYFLIQ